MSEIAAFEARREELRRKFGVEDVPAAGEAVWTGGVHHLALICSDIEATIRFYTDVVGMRLTKIVPNRDEPSSTHIFLDMGGNNLLAFFDFPLHGAAPAVRGVGSMHHVAIRAEPEQYRAVLAELKGRGIAHSIHGDEQRGSVYFRDPDNILLEITSRAYED